MRRLAGARALSVVLSVGLMLSPLPLLPTATVAEASRIKQNVADADGLASKPGYHERFRNNKFIQKVFYAPRERVGSEIYLSTERGVSARRSKERIGAYVFAPALGAMITQGSGDTTWISMMATGILTGMFGAIIESAANKEREDPRLKGFLGAESPFASGIRGLVGSAAVAGAWLTIASPLLSGSLDATKDPTVNLATWMAIASAFVTTRVIRKIRKNEHRAEDSW